MDRGGAAPEGGRQDAAAVGRLARPVSPTSEAMLRASCQAPAGAGP
jgi:hypothetical protein